MKELTVSSTFVNVHRVIIEVLPLPIGYCTAYGLWPPQLKLEPPGNFSA